MTVPGVASPPERAALDSPSFGDHELLARIAEGARSVAWLSRSSEGALWTLRRPRPGTLDDDLLADAGRIPGARILSDDGAIALAYPAIVGENLATILARFLDEGRALPLPVALTIAMGVASRLEALGGVHGDLVPHHVLVGFDGGISVIDPAGAATAAVRGREPSREGYRSPEHLDGSGLDATADVFVLGVLLFEMTTGQRLFDGDSDDVAARIRAAETPRPRDLVGDGYPIELQLVLRKLMRPSRGGRFPTPRAAQDALRLVATTRADVGPGPLGSWLRTEFVDRHARWSELLGADSPAPTGPLAVRPRAPSRAETRPSTEPGRGEPTIEELRLDSPTLQAVRAAIAARGASGLAAPEDDRLRAELTALKSRRVDLPALEGPRAERTQPAAARPGPPDARTDPEAPARHRRRQGLAASPPPNMVPELPTEVTRRYPVTAPPLDAAALTSGSKGTDAAAFDRETLPPLLADDVEDDSGAPTSLDEIEWATDAPAAFDVGGLDALSAEALLAPTTDKGPAPGPEPAREPASPTGTRPVALSADLVLDGAPEQAAQGLLELASDLEATEAEDRKAGADLGDTVQEDDGLTLEPADLDRLQRAVEVMAPAGTTDPGQIEAQTAGAFYGSAGGASGEAEVAAGSPWTPAPAPRLPSPPPMEPRPPASPAQAHIATQVVRDRIVTNAPEPQDLWDDRRPGALMPEADRELSPTPHLDLGPPREVPATEDTSAGLVIPIPDEELAAQEAPRSRRRLGGWLMFAAAATIALGGTGWLLWSRALPRPAPFEAAAPSMRPPAPPTPSERPTPAAADVAPGDQEAAPTPAKAAPDPATAREARRAPSPRAPPTPEEDGTWTLRVRVLPERATVEVDGNAVPNDSEVTLSGDAPVSVRASAPGYEPMTKRVRPDNSQVLILLRRAKVTGAGESPDEAL